MQINSNCSHILRRKKLARHPKTCALKIPAWKRCHYASAMPTDNVSVRMMWRTFTSLRRLLWKPWKSGLINFLFLNEISSWGSAERQQKVWEESERRAFWWNKLARHDRRTSVGALWQNAWRNVRKENTAKHCGENKFHVGEGITRC